ncbi:MAG: MFS transporter, partial [Acutalibacteraceae bacterium]|nr:MFS transporter [Acutalibacteraceae bacterium]
MNIKCSNKAKASDGAHLLIFLAWLLYTVSYLGKLNYSANITQIVDYYQISKAQAGIVPSFFFFAYGIGQVVNGLLCKKYNIKWMIFLSLFVSAVINLVIALKPNFEIIKWLWMINGFMLSILWPTLVRLLTGALPQKDLGKSSVIMGTPTATGTLVIYGLCSVFAMFDMFKLSFYTASFLDLAVAVLWLFLYKKAFKCAYEEKEKEVISHNNETKKEKSFENDKVDKSIIYITIFVLCLYAVIVNLTKDGLTTWVPSILKENFAMSDSVSILLTLTLPIVAIFGNLIALKMHKFIPDYIT